MPGRLSLPGDFVGSARYIKLIATPVGSSHGAVTDEFKIERRGPIDWTLLRPIETSIATRRIAIGAQD